MARTKQTARKRGNGIPRVRWQPRVAPPPVIENDVEMLDAEVLEDERDTIESSGEEFRDQPLLRAAAAARDVEDDSPGAMEEDDDPVRERRADLFGRLRDTYKTPIFAPTAPQRKGGAANRDLLPTHIGFAPDATLSIRNDPESTAPTPDPVRTRVDLGPGHHVRHIDRDTTLNRYDREVNPAAAAPPADEADLGDYTDVHRWRRQQKGAADLGIDDDLVEALGTKPMTGAFPSGYYDPENTLATPGMSRGGQRASQMLTHMSRVAYVALMQRRQNRGIQSLDPVEVQHGFTLTEDGTLRLAAASNQHGPDLEAVLDDRQQMLENVLALEDDALGSTHVELVQHARRAADRLVRWKERMKRLRRSDDESPADLDLANELFDLWVSGDMAAINADNRHAEQDVMHYLARKLPIGSEPDEVLADAAGTRFRCFGCTAEIGDSFHDQYGRVVTGKAWPTTAHPTLMAEAVSKRFAAGKGVFTDAKALPASSASEDERSMSEGEDESSMSEGEDESSMSEGEDEEDLVSSKGKEEEPVGRRRRRW